MCALSRICLYLHALHLWTSKTRSSTCSVCVGFGPSGTLIFKSQRGFPLIKYWSRWSLDLYGLGESLCSHWFLTRQIGQHYSKVLNNQLHMPLTCLPGLSDQWAMTSDHSALCVWFEVSGPECWVGNECFSGPFMHNFTIFVRPKHSQHCDGEGQQRQAREHHLLSPVTRKEDRLRASYRGDQLHIVFNPLHLRRL